MKNKPFIIHPSPSSRQDTYTLERRRFKAVRLFERGMKQAEVARQCKATKTAVHYWYATWKQSGKDGLQARRPGPKPRLTQGKADRMKEFLMRGAEAAGYDTDLWTLERIAAALHKQLRVSYKPTQVWYIMRALGWSNQKPETRYRNRNEAAIRRWKRESFPQIQKRG